MIATRFRRRAVAIATGVILTLIGLAFQTTDQQFFRALRDRMDWIAYDLRMQYTLPEQPEPHAGIVVIDVDDESLTREGRWPWPRAKIARLVDKLGEYGVVVIAMDMIFAEPEKNSAQRLLHSLDGRTRERHTGIVKVLRELAARAGGDDALSRSLADKDVVLSYAFRPDDPRTSGAIGRPLTVTDPEELHSASIARVNGFTGNLPLLQEAAGYGGFINATPDSDGIARRSKLVLRYGAEVYPALALEAARVMLLADKVEIGTAPIGQVNALEYVSLGDYEIPTDGKGAAIIPYRGGPYSFRYISATDVLSGAADPDLLAGTVAIVGTTAPGLFDLRTTPVSSSYPGVEVHASILAGILDHEFPREPEWARGVNFVTILALGLFLAIALPFSNPVRMVVYSALIAVGLVVFNIWMWAEQQFILSLAIPLLTVFLLTSANLAYGFIFESRSRRQLKDQFGQYVPPQLVEEMAEHPDTFGLEGERREMSVLFADIRGFTTLAETMPPTELKDLLDRFFTPMTEIIFHKRGTIDKYVGDMIMAFWGAPVRDEEHAQHAIDAALAMLEKVEQLKPEFTRLGWPEIRIGVGINSGPMSVGNMGSRFRRAYTVIGDEVNLASRLEGLTKYYHVDLIVGEHTRAALDQFVFRTLDKVRVKGRHEPVSIYEVLARESEAPDALRAEVAQYEEAFACYLNRQWEEADRRFRELAAAHPDCALYDLYVQRINEASTHAFPGDWDGVFGHKVK